MDIGVFSQQISGDAVPDKGAEKRERKHPVRSRKSAICLQTLRGEASQSYKSIMSITLGRGSVLQKMTGFS